MRVSINKITIQVESDIVCVVEYKQQKFM
jgi:hypothetical protein